MSAPAAVSLGVFPVSGDEAAAAAFRASTGLGPDGDRAFLPLTYPMRWMVLPEVRAALAGMVTDPHLVLVHEAQTFDYTSPLRVGETYTLTLTGRRQHAPERLVVDGAMTGADGSRHATLETVIRLFSTATSAP